MPVYLCPYKQLLLLINSIKRAAQPTQTNRQTDRQTDVTT